MAKRREKRWPTHGPEVCSWMESVLVHGEGDFFGEPFRLTDDQARFLYQWYEYADGGRYRYRRALLGRPKGSGKTELGAAIGLAELAGPLAQTAPVIPVGAASWEQADLLFGTARVMVSEGALQPFFDVFDTEIVRRGGPGRMYRIAAIAGTNDGPRPTFFLADEIHEWLGARERVHVVISNGLAKRKEGRSLSMTTAGSDMETLAGAMYEYGQKVQSGEITDGELLFDWREASEAHDLTTPDGLEAAIREAYGDVLGVTIQLENIISRYRELSQAGKDYEFQRYYLNRWTASPVRWLPVGAWDACATPDRVVEAGTRIAIGFDGSYNQDSTALVGVTVEDTPHVFVLGCWEKPEHEPDWIVPRSEVTAAVHAALERYDVSAMCCDPPGWHREIEGWAETYGSYTIVLWETNRRKQMSAACDRFYGLVVNRGVTHDGDPRLARHLASAVVKETSEGALITKDRRGSKRKIDLAIAAVLGLEGSSLYPGWDATPLMGWSEAPF